MTTALKAVFLLPLMFFAPGYLALACFMKPGGGRYRFYRLELLVIAVGLSTVVTILIGLALGLVGRFTLLYLAASIGVLDAGLLALGWKRFQPLKRRSEPLGRPGVTALVLVVVVAALCLLYAHPFAFDLMHHREAGDNVSLGILLGRTGTFFPRDSLFVDVPEEYRPDIYVEGRGNFDLFPTYRLRMDSAGKVRLWYFYVYPVAVGAFYALLGLEGALFVSTLLMLLSVGLMFVLARLLLGGRAAIAAALLFGFSFIAVYFSWFHETEALFLPVMLLLLVCFVYLLRAQESDRAMQAGLALAIPLLHLSRPEALLVFAGIALFVILAPWNGLRPLKAPLLIGTAALVLTSGFYLLYLPRRYLLGSDSGSDSIVSNRLLLLVAGAGVLLAALAIFAKRLTRTVKRATWDRLNLLLFFAFALLGFIGLMRLGVDQPGLRLNNVISMSWYVWIIVTALMFGGMLAFFWLERGTPERAVACIIAPTLIFFLTSTRNHPLHPWVMRRYLPVVFPALMIFAGYASVKLADVLKSRRASNIAFAAIVAVALVTLFVSYTPLVRQMRNGTTVSGLTDELEGFKKKFKDTDVLVFNNDDLELGIALPLKTVYGMNSLILPREIMQGSTPQARVRVANVENLLFDENGIEKYLGVVGAWVDQERSVYIINPTRTFLDLLTESPEWTLLSRPEKSLSTTLTGYTWEYDRVPQKPIDQGWTYDVYEIRKANGT